MDLSALPARAPRTGNERDTPPPIAGRSGEGLDLRLRRIVPLLAGKWRIERERAALVETHSVPHPWRAPHGEPA
jgi:hypothetical protein